MTLVSTLGQSLDQIDRLKTMQLQLSTLQSQIATGKKTQLYKGLGTDVIQSERSRANFTSLDNYINNIDIADRRMKLMITSLQELKGQTENVLNGLEIQTQEGEFELDSLSDLATNVKEFLYNLINERDGARFLFGGAETLTQPITNSGTLDTYVQTQLDEWVNTNITTDELIASYRNKDTANLHDTLVGYSATLSSGSAKDVTVRVDEYSEINYTVLANDSAFRDIMVGISMIEHLGQTIDEVAIHANDDPNLVYAPGATQQEQNENFYKMFNDVATMLNGALDQVEVHVFELSQSQAQITQIREDHQQEQSILLETISAVEDVDLNEVAVKLNGLQLQLEASYRVTASIQGLSLVNFI